MLYSCKPLFDKIKAQVGAEIDSFPLEDPPTVCIITTGEDEPSARYVRNKLRDFKELGIDWEVKRFDTIYDIGFMLRNENSAYDGIIVQRPILVSDAVPKDAASWVSETMSPSQDIDGVVRGSGFVPPSVRGLDLLLQEWDYDPAGKMTVVTWAGLYIVAATLLSILLGVPMWCISAAVVLAAVVWEIAERVINR